MEKPPFEPQTSPDHIWVIAYDTVIGGWDCVKIEIDGEMYIALNEKEQGLKECLRWKELLGEDDVNNVDGEYFLVHKDDYIHHRRVMPLELQLKRIIYPKREDSR
jgi:hypothetical protein